MLLGTGNKLHTNGCLDAVGYTTPGSIDTISAIPYTAFALTYKTQDQVRRHTSKLEQRSHIYHHLGYMYSDRRDVTGSFPRAIFLSHGQSTIHRDLYPPCNNPATFALWIELKQPMASNISEMYTGSFIIVHMCAA